MIGPDTPATGEQKAENQLFQNQIAKTLAQFLGYQLENGKPIGVVIQSVFKK